MRNFLRWSAVLTGMLLVLAACQSSGGSPSAAASAAASGQDPTAVCAADTFGCVQYGPSDPINLGTSLVITGANSSLGLDSQYGVKVAIALRGQVAGHDVKETDTDDGCSADGGTASANQLKADTSIVAVVGTSCSSAGVKAAEILSQSGIFLLSPSNTAPSLTDPADSPALLRAHRTQRQDPGQGNGGLRLHRAEGQVGSHHQRWQPVCGTAPAGVCRQLQVGVRRHDHDPGSDHRRPDRLQLGADQDRSRQAGPALLPDLRGRGCSHHPAGKGDRRPRDHDSCGR